RRTNDELFCLYNEEEYQAAKNKPRPDPERDRFDFKHVLEWWGVGEQELKDHNGTDPEGQVLVTEMRLRGQRGVEFVTAVEQVEDLTDHQSIHRHRAREFVGGAFRLHPEERPQGERE